MSARRLTAALAALVAGCAVGLASAKLPPPTDEQKAKAVETKAKADETAKREAELLGRHQDRVVEHYKRGRVVKTTAPAPR